MTLGLRALVRPEYAKIGHLHVDFGRCSLLSGQLADLRLKQHVLKLQVTMNDTLIVAVFNSFGDLEHDLGYLILGHLPALEATPIVIEFTAGQVLHYNEHLTVGWLGERPCQLHYVLVLKLTQSFELLFEHTTRGIGSPIAEVFNRYVVGVELVKAQIHHAEAALAEVLLEAQRIDATRIVKVIVDCEDDGMLLAQTIHVTFLELHTRHCEQTHLLLQLLLLVPPILELLKQVLLHNPHVVLIWLNINDTD